MGSSLSQSAVSAASSVCYTSASPCVAKRSGPDEADAAQQLIVPETATKSSARFWSQRTKRFRPIPKVIRQQHTEHVTASRQQTLRAAAMPRLADAVGSLVPPVSCVGRAAVCAAYLRGRVSRRGMEWALLCDTFMFLLIHVFIH